MKYGTFTVRAPTSQQFSVARVSSVPKRPKSFERRSLDCQSRAVLVTVLKVG